MVVSCPGFLPTIVAHRLRRYSPNIDVLAENAQDRIPGISPIEAKADGKASAPAPIMVLARFETEDWIVAWPCFSNGGSGGDERRGVRRETWRDRCERDDEGVAP